MSFRELSQTVISQYSNSPIIDKMVELFAQAVDPDRLFDLFFDQLWGVLLPNNLVNPNDLPTYGFDVWGRIVGVQRVIQGNTGPFLGFSGPGGQASGVTFNFGIFYSGQPSTTNFSLTNQSFLLLILAKAAANITDGSIASFNQILLNLFPGRGNCYMQDNYDMTVVIVFKFVLQPFEVAIVENSGVLPVPCGVAVSYSYL